MPSSFTITAATNSVLLDSNRRAEASFTVYNASGQPRRGRARIVALQPEAGEWFDLRGEIERDFNIGGTSQYTVGIAAPPTVPAGNYSFRLNMVGVDNPDEDFTEGQAVTFEVPEPEPKRQIPWKIPAIVAAVLLVVIAAVAGILATRGPGQVEVPDVARSTVADATEILVKANFKVASETAEETSDSIEQGLVIATNPLGGSKMESGGEITLIVSGGGGAPEMATVPDVAGSSVIDAATVLAGAGFKVSGATRDEFSSEVAAGMVIGTEPPADGAVEFGREITLIVSRGPIVVSPDTPAPTIPPAPTGRPSATTPTSPLPWKTFTAMDANTLGFEGSDWERIGDGNGLPGLYLLLDDLSPGDLLDLKDDGTFELEELDELVTGQWQQIGDEVLLIR